LISNFISHLDSLKASEANKTACRTALAMLFRLQGFSKETINGTALK
jgi:hypothetical protein